MTTDGSAYAFQVEGHLGDQLVSWLGDLTITHNDDGTSTLVGFIIDQAQLHGLLAKLRDLGIALIAVAPATRPARPSDAGVHQAPPRPEHSPTAGQQSPQASPETE